MLKLFSLLDEYSLSLYNYLRKFKERHEDLNYNLTDIKPYKELTFTYDIMFCLALAKIQTYASNSQRSSPDKKISRIGALNDCYIIFICLDDPFNEGRYKYTYRNRCDEDFNLILNDGVTRIFLNVSGTKGNVTDDVKNFLNYLITNKAADALTTNIDNAVELQRESEKGEVIYM